MLTLEDEDEEGAAGGGTGALREDEEWLGRLCDEEEDDEEGFFFFLTDVGASYVRNDSKDMVGVSKSSSSSLDGEALRTRCRPEQQQKGEVRDQGDERWHEDSLSGLFAV